MDTFRVEFLAVLQFDHSFQRGVDVDARQGWGEFVVLRYIYWHYITSDNKHNIVT